MLLLLLPVCVVATTTLTLDDAVARAKEAAAAKDGPEALEIEAERLEDGSVEFDDVRVGVEHRSVDRFLVPEINNDTDAPFSATDNIGVNAQVPVPRLDDLVKKSSADLRAEAARTELQENARDVATDVRRLVVHVASLKRERALLQAALSAAQERETLLFARRESGTATVLDADDAARERLGLAADLVGVDDDLQQARADLGVLLDSDDDVDDDIEARCQAPLPDAEQALTQARAADPRTRRLQLLDEALDREALAGWLGYVPWLNRLEAAAIFRDDAGTAAEGRRDNYRLGVVFDVPVFHVFDSAADAVAVRQRANEREQTVADARLSRRLLAARDAVSERRKMVALLAQPPVAADPDDRAVVTELLIHRAQSERQRLRAIARCARAVVDVVSLISE